MVRSGRRPEPRLRPEKGTTMAADNPRDFVDALVEDPANPPQLQTLAGYRGRSAKEGHTRLYSDPELSGWVDIPDDAILLTRETRDDYGLGRSLVWVKADAQLEAGPQQAGGGTGADFLQGQVAQDLGAAPGLQARQTLRTQINCPTHAPFLCLQTPFRLCPPRTHVIQQCLPSIAVFCLPTHNVRECVPQLTHDPHLCVASPNPLCGGHGPIGDPGGPVELRAQGFAAQAAFTPVPQCLQPIQTAFCPVPVTQQPFCLITRNFLQCHPSLFCPTNPAVCLPVSPWCPIGTITGPPTTPQFGNLTPQLGNFAPQPGGPVFGADPTEAPALTFSSPICPTHAGPVCGGFGGDPAAGGGFQGVQAQGGVGAVAATQFCQPPTRLCPATFQQCPPTQNTLCPLTSNPHVCGLPHTVVNCPTINPVCQPITAGCGPFGGGGGGGF